MDDDGLSWSTSDFDSSGGFLGSNSGIEESTNLYEEGQNAVGAGQSDEGGEGSFGSYGAYGYDYPMQDGDPNAYGETQDYTGADVDTNLSDWADPAPTADNPYGL